MMSETSDANAEANGDFPNFSSLDVVKLHAACVMSICGALDAAGLINRLDMAELLAAHARDEGDAPWAQVVRSIALTLAMPDKPTVSPFASHSGPPRSDFVVIEGGARGDPPPKNGS